MDYKKIRTVICILLSAVLMAGCTNAASGSVESPVQKDDKIQIGLSIDSLLIERWSRERDLFVSKAQELGAEVNVQNANGIVEEQIKQIRYFIDKKVDVIVVIAIDDLALRDVIVEAKRQGIKVIAYDRPIRNANVDLYLSNWATNYGEAVAIVPFLAIAAYMIYSSMKTEK